MQKLIKILVVSVFFVAFAYAQTVDTTAAKDSSDSCRISRACRIHRRKESGNRSQDDKTGDKLVEDQGSVSVIH
jgi:hypothetical protein